MTVTLVTIPKIPQNSAIPLSQLAGTLDFSPIECLHLHMAARLTKTLHDSETRQRIQTSQIINRLMKAFDGEVVLDQTQVSIGIALLRKTLPDLSQVESHNQTEVSVISAEPMSPEAWAEAHGAVDKRENLQ